MHHGSILVVVSSFSQRSFCNDVISGCFRQECATQTHTLKSAQQQDVHEAVHHGDISMVVSELTPSPSSVRVVVCRELRVMVQVG